MQAQRTHKTPGQLPTLAVHFSDFSATVLPGCTCYDARKHGDLHWNSLLMLALNFGDDGSQLLQSPSDGPQGSELINQPTMQKQAHLLTILYAIASMEGFSSNRSYKVFYSVTHPFS